MSTFILAVVLDPTSSASPHEVAPAVRELVEDERARRAAAPAPATTAIGPVSVARSARRRAT